MSKSAKTTIRIRPVCVWCRSTRIQFYRCDDDWGTLACLRCDACESQSPGIRAGVDAACGVTHEMKVEAAAAADMIWDEIVSPPAYILVDLIGDREIWHREAPKPARRRRKPARAQLAPAAPVPETHPCSPAIADEHRAVVIPAPAATNGKNGNHNGHGSHA